MAITRKRLEDLTESENLIFRALCSELDNIAGTIQEESSCPMPDFAAIATAQQDRRLVIEWLRRLNLPAAAVYCDGPTEAEEAHLLQEASA
jgi:hypothetical protein